MSKQVCPFCGSSKISELTELSHHDYSPYLVIKKPKDPDSGWFSEKEIEVKIREGRLCFKCGYVMEFVASYELMAFTKMMKKLNAQSGESGAKKSD